MSNMMGYQYMGYHWLWVFVWLFFLALILIGLILIIRSFLTRENGTGRSALDILNERYARGEITKEEYHEKKRDIQGE